MGPPVRQPVTSPLKPVTFDAGALIAFERGDPTVRALAQVLVEDGVPILVPAPAVVEVWRGGTGRQVRLARFLNDGVDRGHVRIVDLDFASAKEAGVLLTRASMSVTDAAVCLCALLAGGTVVTSGPSDIGQLIRPERIHVV